MMETTLSQDPAVEPLRILLIDDMDIDAEVIERKLRRVSVPTSITRARNGYDALDRIVGRGGQEPLREPYAILLDLNMPRMDGFEFLEAMLNLRQDTLPPVLVMTGSTRTLDKNCAEQFPICAYSVKPLPDDTLNKFLDSLSQM